MFVYVFLPFLTNSFAILGSMSAYLDENGIDPTRYFYTDVEQVKEAELYLDSVLHTDHSSTTVPASPEAAKVTRLTSQFPPAVD